MNTDILQGRWRQLRGQIKQQWGLLTDDELDRLSGSADQLAGLIQEKYGMSMAQAQREVDEFIKRHNGGEEIRQGVQEGAQHVQRAGRRMMERGQEAREDLERAGQRMKESGQEAKQELQRAGERVISDARQTATTARDNLEHTVTEKPLISVGAALGLGAIVGLGVGMLIGSGRSDDC